MDLIPPIHNNNNPKQIPITPNANPAKINNVFSVKLSTFSSKISPLASCERLKKREFSARSSLKELYKMQKK